MSDIEDIVAEEVDYGIEDMPTIRIVFFEYFIVNCQNHHIDNADLEDIDITADTIIPEQHKLWIMTFGCAHNFADGEYMKVFLYYISSSLGYFE